MSGAYLLALTSAHTPTVLALTRQALPQLANTTFEGVAHGGYTILGADNAAPNVILAASGSEVSLCVKAAEVLAAAGVHARVVSVPCLDIFLAQPAEYRASVLPDGVPVLAVEAAAMAGWEAVSHAQHGMTTFGASGPLAGLLAHFHFTPADVAAKARRLVEYYASHAVPALSRPCLA